MPTFWLILAGICIVAAAAFLLRGEFNAAFVAAVIGLAAWFLNYRAHVSKSLAKDELKHRDEHKDPEYSDEDEDMEN